MNSMNFLKSKEEIKPKYQVNGNNGCMASNRITVDGRKVGYMYREEPDPTFPDSGWRFFAGDEDDAYCENSENFNIFNLNTICNYDNSIIKYLDSPIGTSFLKHGKKFNKES